MSEKGPAQRRRRDVPNVAAACADFRAGRLAPVDVPYVVSRLEDPFGDHPLNAVSERQHGLALTHQLRRLGLRDSTIAGRVRSGRLFRVFRGVFLVGRAEISDRGRMLAAVLAAGEGTVLSQVSALQLWGALEIPRGPCHVTAPGHRSNRPGLVLHEASFGPNDRAAIDHIPLTAPARSLLDFAVDADPGELERALNGLRSGRLLRAGDLEELRPRTHGHRGWGPLGRLLASEIEPDFSREEAERLLLEAIRAAHLPEPRRNFKIGGWEVDLYWPERGLIVEVDSWAHHGHRRAFESDRCKQADLADLGLEVLRFTWLQITRERLWLIARIAGRLAARAGRP